jgi:hypothetical protein
VCNALPGFHASTGCDTTNQFAGHGKKTALHVFLEDPSLLEKISKHEPNDTIQSYAEEFVVHLYSRSSVETSINNLQQGMQCNNMSEEPTFKQASGMQLLTPIRNPFHLTNLDGKK